MLQPFKIKLLLKADSWFLGEKITIEKIGLKNYTTAAKTTFNNTLIIECFLKRSIKVIFVSMSSRRKKFCS